MQFDSNLNLTKITFDNIDKIIPYLTKHDTAPKAWFNNPLDLIHNEFYYHHIQDSDTILIFKDKLHYGKRILYLMTLPKSNTLTTPEIYTLTEQINRNFDIVTNLFITHHHTLTNYQDKTSNFGVKHTINYSQDRYSYSQHSQDQP